ncbi:DUF4270 domain-containing protein [Algibacter aquimarinus]
MKKTINALKFPCIFLLMIISFIACDKEFSEIDSDVLGKDNSNFDTNNNDFPIVSYNKKLDSLQINGLASNLLGVFNDPAYGKTTASIVTQITPTTFDPSFGTNAVIDSVVLRIPYFSRIASIEGEVTTYTIQDSLYGENQEGNIDPIKLSIYQNNYFLRDFDPFNVGDNNFQNYFSNADFAVNGGANRVLNGTSVIDFETQKGQLIYEDINFEPSAEAIRLDETVDGTVVSQFIAPALRINMDTAFWTSMIFDEYTVNPTILSNTNNFRNYFRGLFIKAEAINDSGSMVLLNLASQESSIIIYYSRDSSIAGERTQSTYTFNFTGNRLNTFVNELNSGINLTNGDRVNGDEKLYLKGGNSMAVVDLFGTDELQDFIDEYRISDGNGGYLKENGTGDFLLKKLINEAQLIIYEDEIMQTFPEDQNGNDYSAFDRIYVYDATNNGPTIDYFLDPTENTTQSFNSRIISLGQRFEDDNGGFKYKIRLTEHLNNILQKDSTNTRLGLVLSTNVNYNNNAEILNSDDTIDGIPAASLLTPRGTILYGSNTTDQKKMTLKIYSTEPRN